MTARQFKKQLERFGWSMAEAARKLGVKAGKSRTGEWARGVRPVPPSVAVHMKTLQELAEAMRSLEAYHEAERKRRLKARQ